MKSPVVSMGIGVMRSNAAKTLFQRTTTGKTPFFPFHSNQCRQNFSPKLIRRVQLNAARRQSSPNGKEIVGRHGAIYIIPGM